MKLFRRILTGTVAALAVAALSVIPARADVYDTPGGHIEGGRLWNTTCEKYSDTVVRCRVSIWATQVQNINGSYRRVTGWHFNNLTYLPAPRATWAGNNLGRNATWTTSDGRKWRTECDTSVTGGNNCRTWAEAKVVKATPSGSGYTYSTVTQWVFNNTVQFATSTRPAITTVPQWVIDQSRLDFTGIGPIRYGAKMSDLTTLGYFTRIENECVWYRPSPSMENRGIDVFWAGSTVNGVLVDKAGVRTVDGARVGMTYGGIKAIYGSRMTLVTKDGYEPVYTAVVNDGKGNEMVFWAGFELDRPLQNSDVITHILARPADDFLGWDGC